MNGCCNNMRITIVRTKGLVELCDVSVMVLNNFNKIMNITSDSILNDNENQLWLDENQN